MPTPTIALAGEKGEPPTPSRARYDPPRVLTPVRDDVLPVRRPDEDRRLRHVSGLVTSWSNVGPNGEIVFWLVQNVEREYDDHRDVYAVLGDGPHRGRILAKFHIDDYNLDWEDLGIAYCNKDGDPNKVCLYILDGGEHEHPRLVDDDLPNVITPFRGLPPRILRVVEPVIPARAYDPTRPMEDLGTLSHEAFPFRYPDYPSPEAITPLCRIAPWPLCEMRYLIHDAEAILPNPDNGNIIIGAKQFPTQWPPEGHAAHPSDKTVLYRYPGPLRPGVVTLERMREVDPIVAGGAGVSSDGLRAVLRNDAFAYEYWRNPNEPFEAMFDPSHPPRLIWLCAGQDEDDTERCQATMETHGEAIAYCPEWLCDERVIFTINKTVDTCPEFEPCPRPEIRSQTSRIPFPDVTTLISPVGETSIDRVEYTWRALPDVEGYDLWVNVKDRDESTIHRWYTARDAGCPDGAGTCHVTPDASLSPGVYQWTVMGQNADGVGPWSPGLEFRVTPSR